MPTNYRIERAQAVVFTTFTGEITFEEVVAHAVALRGDPLFHPAYGELLDLRHMTDTNLTFEELQHLARTIDPFSSKAKRATVAPTQVSYETSCTYPAARNDDSRRRLFGSIAAARKWLALPDESAAPRRLKPLLSPK